MTRFVKYCSVTISGVVAGLLEWPFISGAVHFPSYVLIAILGITFSLFVLPAVSWCKFPASDSINTKSWLTCAFALAFGIPVALVIGVAALELVSQFIPGSKYFVGDTGLPSFLAELASCITWSVFLCLGVAVLTKVKIVKMLPSIIATIVALMIIMNLIDFATFHYYQKSVPLELICIAEQAVSALILALSVAEKGTSSTSHIVGS